MPFFEKVALQPSALNGTSDLVKAALIFGFTKGRLLTRLPREWLRNVSERFADLPEPQRTAARRLLERLGQNALIPYRRKYSDEDTWIKNAVNAKRLGDTDRVVVVNDEPDCEVFATFVQNAALGDERNTDDVPHTADSLERVCRPIFEAHARVALVDPYFDIADDRAAKILATMIGWRLPISDANVDVFCKEELVRRRLSGISDTEKMWASYDVAMHRSLSKQRLQERKINITVRALSGTPAEIHDRYLIGARGGISIGRGFLPTGESNQTVVTLLSAPHLEKKCSEFLDGAHGFEVAHEYKWPEAAPAKPARI